MPAGNAGNSYVANYGSDIFYAQTTTNGIVAFNFTPGTTNGVTMVGISDGTWIEVTNRRLLGGADGQEHWAPVDGSEQVILGDLSILTEGAEVRVDASTPKKPEQTGAGQ